MSTWKKYKLGEIAQINPRVPLKQGGEYSFVEMKDFIKCHTKCFTFHPPLNGLEFRRGGQNFKIKTRCLPESIPVWKMERFVRLKTLKVDEALDLRSI